jgi:hypothetical protein
MMTPDMNPLQPDANQPSRSLPLSPMPPSLKSKATAPNNDPVPSAIQELLDLPPEALFDAFKNDPMEVLMAIMHEYFVLHMNLMQQSSDFNNSLRIMQLHDPDYLDYEQQILEEAKQQLLNHPEGDNSLDYWPVLLKKSKDQVKTKLEKELTGKTLVPPSTPPPSHGVLLEKGNARKGLPTKPTFTRAQIAKMTREDYLANEAAILLALKEGRIK